ncbi:MAG TPA: FliH/SctL family protein [Woeseiaceae bacterium]|nr:FliH/SctL family protein [Woeseiaceae bacterium]
MSDSQAQAAVTRRWDVPAIDGSASGFPTAGRLEALQQEAYEEAYRQGYEEGLAAGREAAAERAARLDELCTALARPLDELDESVEQALAELAMTVVRQLFRRELKLDPTHVVGVVREALRVLPAGSRDVKVYLHPDDAALVAECLSPAEGVRAWSIVEDPLVARGGCRVTTPQSQVDARAETRLEAVIAAALGDERQ